MRHRNEGCEMKYGMWRRVWQKKEDSIYVKPSAPQDTREEVVHQRTEHKVQEDLTFKTKMFLGNPFEHAIKVTEREKKEKSCRCQTRSKGKNPTEEIQQTNIKRKIWSRDIKRTRFIDYLSCLLLFSSAFPFTHSLSWNRKTQECLSNCTNCGTR